MNDEDYKKMSEEGRELAQNLLPKLGKWTGQMMTVDQLKERVQKQKADKVSKLLWKFNQFLCSFKGLYSLSGLS